MNHDQFREIFRIIDESIWEIINMRYSDDELVPLGKRISLMDRCCEDAKKILSEYIDRSSERMRRLLDSDAFKRFPAARSEAQAEMIPPRQTPLFPTSGSREAFSDLQERDGHPASDRTLQNFHL